MLKAIKLSSPETSEFWEIPILLEDEHLLVLDKPAGLMVSPDGIVPDRPSLMGLLHRDIERGALWAKERNMAFLMNANRPDSEASGVIVLARSKEALASITAEFGSEKPNRIYNALVRGVAALEQTEFKTDAKLSPHPLQMGVVRIDPKDGKRAKTEFTVKERFEGYMLMECRPLTERLGQVRAHLKHVGFRPVADEIYGGPPLMLSSLKPNYRLKEKHEERPLINRPALHLCEVIFPHPVTGVEMHITSPLTKDFSVSLKYLKRYAQPH